MKLHFVRAKTWDENDELMEELQPYASAQLENPTSSGYWDPRGLFAIHITNVIQSISDCDNAIRIINLIKKEESTSKILSDKYEIRKARIESTGVTFFIQCKKTDQEIYTGLISLDKYMAAILHWKDFISEKNCIERIVDIPDY
ncbi:hypothetical protein ACO0LL_27620 [Undibacterium sp. TC4M20W]|uniref:hypothetical protein n=1 Tax=Undibacterium sp. TC4M20W TaxID=3413052 RepID=UPI003BF4024E